MEFEEMMTSGEVEIAESENLADDAEPVNQQEEQQDEQREDAQADEQKQSPEENAKFANMRRKLEAEFKAKTDSFFASQYKGKTNPVTGKEILTEEDAKAYDAAMMRSGYQKSLEDLGINTDLAKGMADAILRGQEQQQKDAEVQRKSNSDAAIQEQIEALKKAYPNCGINSADDLMSDGELLAEAVQRSDGDLVKAYRIAHWKDISQQQTSAAKQAAINSARGTSHIKSVSGAKDDGDDLTEEQYRMYELFGYSRKQASDSHKKLYK